MIDIEPIRRRYLAAAPFLNERGRRVLAAAEAKVAGAGGISAVAKATGVARSTIRRGLADVAVGVANIPGRVRRPGGGRRSAERSQPGLLKALEGLVDGAIRGDPESPLRWVSRSQRRLSRELAARGFRASQRTVARLLRGLGFSLQANRKTREGGVHPDRDEQFQTINRLILSHQADGQPAISVDTKKKELVGDFKNGGRELRPTGEPEAVRVHDFEDKGLGKVVPYGVYDIAANKGWVRLGVDNDTAAFAVETIRRAAGGRRSATRGIPAPGAFSSPPTAAARTARASGSGSANCSASPTTPGWRSPSRTCRPAPASGTRSSTGSSPSSR